MQIMKKLLLITAMLFTLVSNAQVRLVKNHNGFSSSNLLPRFVLNNKLIYAALNPSLMDIFHSNGTTNGSSYIFDTANGLRASISPTSDFSYAILNGEAHFMANYWSASTGSYSRITKAGFTNTVCDSYGDLGALTGSAASELASPVVLNNEILFRPSTVFSGNVVGVELYKSTGSTLSLLKDINPGATLSSLPAELTVLGTNCFFSANDGTNGRELWKTDGTPSGTILYLDVFAGGSNSNPAELKVLGSSLTFAATHPTYGRELFKTNGTGSLTLLKDISTTGTGNGNPTNCTVIDGLLYFSADNGVNGQELWVSGGTTLSTQMVYDISPTASSSNPSKFTQLGTTVFFIATDPLNGRELWKTDGTNSGTFLVKDINPINGSSNPDYLTPYNGKLYFTADNGTNGVELWVTDGTASGTTMIEINPTGSSTISTLIVYNNELYFVADAGTGIGKELYAYMDPALATNEFQLNENAIKLFPNPSKSFFELLGEVAIEEVVIYSIQGQLVKSFQKQSQYIISDLAKGMYIVKINTTEGILNKTLIIE
jgi:ELWxxDGT repeat protein